jgi:hypothetical protein
MQLPRPGLPEEEGGMPVRVRVLPCVAPLVVVTRVWGRGAVLVVVPVGGGEGVVPVRRAVVCKPRRAHIVGWGLCVVCLSS